MTYSVFMNGLPWGNFGVGRGLQQGDLVLPYLFIMVAEVLERALLRKVERGEIKGIKLTTSLSVEVIQQFVDDTFLSGDSSILDARSCKHVPEIYVVNAGQKINLDKSKVYFFNTKSDF